MAYDATELVKKYRDIHRSILIDQGTKDAFLNEQLNPHSFLEAIQDHDYLSVNYQTQPGYDHS
jgi:S-formylglutathione hydrolase